MQRETVRRKWLLKLQNTIRRMTTRLIYLLYPIKEFQIPREVLIFRTPCIDIFMRRNLRRVGAWKVHNLDTRCTKGTAAKPLKTSDTARGKCYMITLKSAARLAMPQVADFIPHTALRGVNSISIAGRIKHTLKSHSCR